jgi:hypothetical protein
MLSILLPVLLVPAPPQDASEKLCPLRPAVVIPGYHELGKAGFFIINSQQAADATLAKALSSTSFLQAPRVDYSRYSAVFVCRPKERWLVSLKLESVEASENTLKISYSCVWLDQVFIGLNDNVARAPFLFVVVPKWEGSVQFYEEEDAIGNPGAWILRAKIQAER